MALGSVWNLQNTIMYIITIIKMFFCGNVLLFWSFLPTVPTSAWNPGYTLLICCWAGLWGVFAACCWLTKNTFFKILTPVFVYFVPFWLRAIIIYVKPSFFEEGLRSLSSVLGSTSLRALWVIEQIPHQLPMMFSISFYRLFSLKNICHKR